MKTNTFLSSLDHTRIERAITAAELRTSGELRVVVHPEKTDDPLAVAAKEFSRLGMERTRDRNAVLLLVAPSSQTFAVFGDTGIHAKCGPQFWQELADTLTTDFKRHAFTDGIVAALTKAGDLLAVHFPRGSDDLNELADHVIDRPPVI